MKEVQNQRKPPKYEVRLVPEYGEIGAGHVVPFAPRNKLVPVALPTGTKEDDVGTVIVSGCSLEDEGILDGDRLIFTKKFNRKSAMFEAICIVHIVSTGELVAKKLVPLGGDMLALRSSGGGIKDVHYHRDDIEIKGIAIGFQRMFKNGRPG